MRGRPENNRLFNRTSSIDIKIDEENSKDEEDDLSSEEESSSLSRGMTSSSQSRIIGLN